MLGLPRRRHMRMTVTLLSTSVESAQLLLFRVIAPVNGKCVKWCSRGAFWLLYETVLRIAFLIVGFCLSHTCLIAVHHAVDHLILTKWRIRKVTTILETRACYVKGFPLTNQSGILRRIWCQVELFPYGNVDLVGIDWSLQGCPWSIYRTRINHEMIMM